MNRRNPPTAEITPRGGCATLTPAPRFDDRQAARAEPAPPRTPSDRAGAVRARYDRVATALARHPTGPFDRARQRVAIELLLAAGTGPDPSRLFPDVDTPDVVLHRIAARALRGLDLADPAACSALREAERLLSA